MPTRHSGRRPAPARRERRDPPARWVGVEPFGDGATTAVLLLDVAPGFQAAAQRRLLEITGVVAVARTCRENRLRVQLTASDPYRLRRVIDGQVKRVPGVHRCRVARGDGSSPGTCMQG